MGHYRGRYACHDELHTEIESCLLSVVRPLSFSLFIFCLLVGARKAVEAFRSHYYTAKFRPESIFAGPNDKHQSHQHCLHGKIPKCA